MSSSDSDNDMQEGGPVIEVVYPVGEETEVPQTNGKLFKTVLAEGNGAKPPRNSKVTVSYKGTLASDGTPFDSSDSFDFTIGAGQVIKGWDQGVATMRKGERAILKCLPEYAYGASGSPPTIPPNATLNFEVEVKDWSKMEDVSEKKDKSILKSVKFEGRNWDTPEYESQVKADIVISTGTEETEDKVQIYSQENWSIVVGETALPAGLETALCTMKEGESASVVVSGRIVTADSQFNVPAGATITYDITVHSLHKVKTWSFKGADKVREGLKRKDEGNAYFKAGNWGAAEKKYRRSLEFVESEYDLDDDQKAEAKKVKIAALSNLAQVLLNLKSYKEAIVECNKVLAVDGGNIKALFRRGKAQGLLDEWEDAKSDLTHVIEMDPSNADARNELEVVKAKIRAHDQKQKKNFGNLFQKLAAMEEKEHSTA